MSEGFKLASERIPKVQMSERYERMNKNFLEYSQYCNIRKILLIFVVFHLRTNEFSFALLTIVSFLTIKFT